MPKIPKTRKLQYGAAKETKTFVLPKQAIEQLKAQATVAGLSQSEYLSQLILRGGQRDQGEFYAN